MKPTFSTEEVIILIMNAKSKDELKAINEIVFSEKKRYPLSVLRAINILTAEKEWDFFKVKGN